MWIGLKLNRIRASFSHLSVILIAAVFALLSAHTVAAQTSPGAAFFSYECRSYGFDFFLQGSFVLRVTFTEISDPLARALALNQNQPIKSTAEIGLWALKSDELQIHQNKDPDLTKYVIPVTACGPLNTGASSAASSQSLAYVQLNGPGQAFAYAQVTASGQTLAYAQVSGEGIALAAAQSTVPADGSTPTGTSAHVHIVQKGENLFRIALRYNTTVAVLSQLNNISDPARIYVGQTIILPA